MIGKLLIWGEGRMAHAVAECANCQGITAAYVGRNTSPTGSYDAVIDFSHPSQTKRLLDYVLPRALPLVIGTTGHTQEQLAYIIDKGNEIPLCIAANFSLGVAAVKSAAKLLTRLLNGWQATLIETHRVGKADAPSGTAKEIAALMSPAPDVVSLRMGEEKGTHTLIFSGAGERITLQHRADDVKIFAQGALTCANSLANKLCGIYTVEQLCNYDET